MTDLLPNAPRRKFLRLMVAAPAIVAIGNIMPVKALRLPRSTALVIASPSFDGEWRVAHRGTRLALSYDFASYEEAAEACREIDARFDLDAIASKIGAGTMPEVERRAIYDIQARRGGFLYVSTEATGIAPEAQRIIRAWQRGEKVPA